MYHIYKKNFFKFFYAILFGIIGIKSFAPYNIWFCSIFSLCGLQLILLYSNSLKESTLIGFFWGIGFFGYGISWIYISISNFSDNLFIVNIILISILIIYLSLYPAIFSFLINFFFKNTKITRFIFASPSIWQIIEYIRSSLFTGFSWLQFGYTQIDGPLKYIAPIFGVEMITFLLMIISGLIIFSLIKKRFFVFFISLILLFSSKFFKEYKWYIENPKKKATIALVQGNIPQKLKWNHDFIKKIKEKYLNLSKYYLSKVDIIIWPESAIPSNELENNEFLTNLDLILRNKKTSLITGIIESNKNQYFNSIIVLGDETPYHYPTKNRYKKYHLVPFGEFIPIKNKISFVKIPQSNFIPGKYKQNQLIVKNIYFSSSICYEIIFSKQIRDNFKKNTDILLTLSNDSWFGNSIGPHQHFQMARMRALELGRPLIRVSNNGITGIINANGQIKNILPQFISGILYSDIVGTIGETPYFYFGSLPIWLITLFFLIISILINKK
ncbi:MAG: apolipoprotein N-acyltransferase [Arsenophonus sp.]|nr:MAG: apolipoprotein N-acyltransferase [Arsenophonus sp.]